MKLILEKYCKAWNHQDLDGIFSLFAEGAEYEGTSKTLRGRTAIREMYEQSFDKGTAEQLEARLAKLLDGAWAVALYKDRKPVALKEFRFADGLITWHSLIEDSTEIANRWSGADERS